MIEIEDLELRLHRTHLFWKDWGEITQDSFGKQRGKHKSSSEWSSPKKVWENKRGRNDKNTRSVIEKTWRANQKGLTVSKKTDFQKGKFCL